jgi:hypothetical protein
MTIMLTSFIHRAHIILGILVAIPVLGWATSGLLYALPSVVEGGGVSRIDVSHLAISPRDAMERANTWAGRELPLTAVTLLMRDGRPVYQAIGGMGADSLLIDAETGVVIKTPPPGFLTRYFRQAHFYFFAGRLQVLFLVVFSALSALSALSGIYLSVFWLFFSPPRKRSPNVFAQR